MKIINRVSEFSKVTELVFDDSRNFISEIATELTRCFGGLANLNQNLFHYRSPPSLSMSSYSENDAEALRRKRILSSKLYFDVSPSKVPLIYSESYDISFLGIEKLHPFDSSKWGRICRFLVSFGILDKESIVEPLEASKDDLLVVHTELYLNSLKGSSKVAMIVEVPPVALIPNCLVQQKVLFPFKKQVGGTVLAAKLAKERGWAINVGGGFHHCSAEKGGGFCVYADISLCIHFAFVQLNISRVMIIDLDAHQGNGHEMDFAYDSRVYILDMYNPGIYPLYAYILIQWSQFYDLETNLYQFLAAIPLYLLYQDYEARNYINQQVEVKSGTLTEEYLQKLDEALEVAGRRFNPELVIYNAGTDILQGDPLGRLEISPEGIALRDEKVFRFAREKNIPIVMLTSGGYMKSSARVIADSIINLSNKCLIEAGGAPKSA
ncbi:histone deacetylase 2 isoform X1 [Vigna radiata var. radiata]|uniref:Histone deacetylase 2 isoform X1 n=1 Tax=Vigna radiata var. radiata TaxID=3916 RepID=A0A3Q0F6K0_VIGRR|nr:histone deacetylase 2 isoform X1 [Vigna radiata var. radiata]